MQRHQLGAVVLPVYAAYDVHVRFTVNAGTYEQARRVLEDLLVLYLNPTSTVFQGEPHEVLDSWGLQLEEE